MNTEAAARIASSLSLPERVTGVEFLDKGYSADRKFIVRTAGESEFLLRTSDIAEEPIRRSDFDHVGSVWKAGVKAPEPIAFGVCEEYSVCYMVLAYIPGDCAEDALPGLSPAESAGIGRQAGEELLRIHRAIEPKARVDDFAIRGAKFLRLRREAGELGFEFKGRVRAEGYVDENVHLLKGRPTTFRHGDFHPGNLVLQGSTLAGVVDFNRCDFGDPIDDFYKTAWFGAPLSAEYANALIRAYFRGEPGAGFWRLYNLYVAAVLPADLVWTHHFYPEHLRAAFALVELIARTHDFVAGGPPKWWTI